MIRSCISNQPLRKILSGLVFSRSPSTVASVTKRFFVPDTEQICELAASNLRYGPGATAEVGQDMADHFKCKKVVLFTDTTVRALPCMQTVQESLERNRVELTVYDNVRVEPNDKSFQQAIQFLKEVDYDGVVALGGGSVLDTAKAANLYACYPSSDFYDHVNPPTGKGQPVPGPLKPVVAIPTTAGTGSETTGVAIFDDTPTGSKTGIAHRHLKPSLGILDPNNLRTVPRAVATFSGLDVLCHAMESYTALPFDQRAPRPTSPLQRPAYQGANPISDVWSLYALEQSAKYLPIAVDDDHPDQEMARSRMILASGAAGMGFGNAGVHLCHGMSYPISSQVKETYQSPYHQPARDKVPEEKTHALIPHGLSVIVSSPAVFSWTAVADPVRHATCARFLATARVQREGKGEAVPTHETDPTGAWVADELRLLCETLQVPLGLRQFGYTPDDIEKMVDGTIQQHRVTKISPRPVDRPALEELFKAAMEP